MVSFAHLNAIDISILSILSFFIVLGLIRGFTSDFLGFFTWIGAIFATKLLYGITKPLIHHYIDSLFFAELLSVVIPFFISLIALVALVHFITRLVQGSIFGGLDRTLGLFSGLIRGSISLCIIYLCLLMYYKPGEKPHWLVQAKLQPYLIWCTKFMYHYVIPQNLFPEQVKLHLFDPRFQEHEHTAHEHVQLLSSPKPAQRKR